jgi:polyisoprenoid-binding protein YceI
MMNSSSSCAIVAGLLFCLRLTALAASFQIDTNQSRIEVAVKSTAGSFTAKLETYHARIECEPAQQLPEKADFVFDFKDLKTGIDGRDKHMLRWLQYSKNPTASFHLKGWKRAGGDCLALGELAIHGVQKEIQMPVAVSNQDDGYDIDGALELDYRDFGLPLIRTALLFSVNPHLKIKFHLAGKLTSARVAL